MLQRTEVSYCRILRQIDVTYDQKVNPSLPASIDDHDILHLWVTISTESSSTSATYCSHLCFLVEKTTLKQTLPVVRTALITTAIGTLIESKSEVVYHRHNRSYS